MYKKLYAAIIAVSIFVMPSLAGGLLTNTNLSASFLRMQARDASIDVYASYYNPAGLSFLPHDGFYMAIDNQSAFQSRNINSTWDWNFDGALETNTYEGEASAPIIPSVFAAYKQGDLTFSALIAVNGGGGKATFNDGLPMFESLINASFYSSALNANPSTYDLNMKMEGNQYIIGGQFGVAYQVNDWLSVYAGGRMNYFTGHQTGTVLVNATDANLQATLTGMGMPDYEMANISLDVDQNGWGVTPIIGVDAKFGKWNIAAKYEFMTNLNIENKANSLLRADFLHQESVAIMGMLKSTYGDGVNTPNDIPALLTFGTSYEILPTLRVNVGAHYFFDKDADMAEDKQKDLEHNTIELLAGVEWQVTNQFMLSTGYQNTDYGLSPEYQKDSSFSCDSYTLGFGGKFSMNDFVAFNVGYMVSFYDDYSADATYGGLVTVQNTYSRTNKVFGFGAELTF